jgi:hypothetical protein
VNDDDEGDGDPLVRVNEKYPVWSVSAWVTDGTATTHKTPTRVAKIDWRN